MVLPPQELPTWLSCWINYFYSKDLTSYGIPSVVFSSFEENPRRESWRGAHLQLPSETAIYMNLYPLSFVFFVCKLLSAWLTDWKTDWMTNWRNLFFSKLRLLKGWMMLFVLFFTLQGILLILWKILRAGQWLLRVLSFATSFNFTQNHLSRINISWSKCCLDHLIMCFSHF